MKRIFAFLLAIGLLLGAASVQAAATVPDLSGLVRANYKEFSQFPLSDGSVKVRIAIPRDDTYGVDAETTWWWTWAQQTSGIDFEIEQVLSSALKDRKSLMFASGDLPDVLWGFGLTTSELMLYGQTEGMLLPLNDYITPEIMPNLVKCMNYDSSIAAAVTCLDGKIYTLPGIRSMPDGESSRTFIDKDLLDKCGLDVPTTLDGFVDTLYAFKKQNADLIPLGGSNSAFNPMYYILNALGYLGEGYNDGTDVAVRDGVALIPAADPTFVEALKVMKKFYDDGIISKDFFTIDATTVNAQMNEGKLGVYPFVPFTVNADPAFYSHWVSVTPLTSQFNDKQQWKRISKFNVGGWVLSAKTDKAEILSKFADFMYSPVGFNLAWLGPFTNSDYTLGMSDGWYVDPQTGSQVFVDVENGKYANTSVYVNQVSCGIYEAVGNNGVWPDLPDYDMNQLREWMQGVTVREPSFDLTQPDPYFRASMFKYISPYEVDGYPTTIYMSQDDVYAMQDLESVLKPYMKGEIAKFITGARDLGEFDAYLGELKGMGSDQYVKYFADNYAKYQANMGK